MPAARQAFLVLAALALGLATLQFFLAGLGVFDVSSFGAHKTVGDITEVVALLLLIAAAVGRLGRTALIYGAGLFVIVVVMGILAGIGDVAGAFHPLLAIVFWFGAFQAVTWARAGEPHAETRAAPH